MNRKFNSLYNKARIDCPCILCSSRLPTCHISCDNYNQYILELKNAKELINQNKNIEYLDYKSSKIKIGNT